MLKKILILVTIILLFNQQIVTAEDTNLKQSIFPENCNISLIDNGSNQYLIDHPELCNNQTPTPTPSPTPTPTSTPQTPSPPNSTPISSPRNPNQTPNNTPVIPIITNTPTVTIEGNSYIFRGTAAPNSILKVYDNGKLIDTIVVGPNGDFSYNFSSDDLNHQIAFQNCIAEICADVSPAITLTLSRSGIDMCNEILPQNFNFKAFKNEDFSPVNRSRHIVVESISWGDDNFSSTLNGTYTAAHQYQNEGNFTGSIKFSANSCLLTDTFSLEVSSRPRSLKITTYATIGSVSLIFLWGIVRIFAAKYSAALMVSILSSTNLVHFPRLMNYANKLITKHKLSRKLFKPKQ